MTNYFYKNYLPIKKLEDKRFWGNNNSFINNELKDGFMHSVYAQLPRDQYYTIKGKYKNANIDKQRFVLYSNNSLLYLVLHSIEGGKEIIKYDTWLVDINQPVGNSNINVFTFFNDHVAYTVEPFSGRFTMLNEPSFQGVSIRHIASGNWIYSDSKNLVLLGISYQNGNNQIEIPTSKRALNRCRIMNDIEPAFSNIFEDLNKKCQYFLLNLVISQSEFLYRDAEEVSIVLKERYLDVSRPHGF